MNAVSKKNRRAAVPRLTEDVNAGRDQTVIKNSPSRFTQTGIFQKGCSA